MKNVDNKKVNVSLEEWKRFDQRGMPDGEGKACFGTPLERRFAESVPFWRDVGVKRK